MTKKMKRILKLAKMSHHQKNLVQNVEKKWLDVNGVQNVVTHIELSDM